MERAARANNYLIKYGYINFIRKLIYLFIQWLSALLHFFRRCRFYFRTRCWIRSIGAGVVIRGIGNRIKFGKDSVLYEKVVIEISEDAKLHVGEQFILSYGGLIACHHSIEIGNHVMIGEYTSIRDTTHDYGNANLVFVNQPNISGPIKIGSNVWIGRGCIIFPHTIIEDDVIVGANSIVKGYLKSNSIYAGAPLKLRNKLYSKE